MRLIDADALLQKSESRELQPTKDTDGFIDGWCEGFNTVVDMIRNQPTAFDQDKVIHKIHRHYIDRIDEADQEETKKLLRDNKVICGIIRNDGKE